MYDRLYCLMKSYNGCFDVSEKVLLEVQMASTIMCNETRFLSCNINCCEQSLRHELSDCAAAAIPAVGGALVLTGIGLSGCLYYCLLTFVHCT